jgi:hypothetical protein
MSWFKVHRLRFIPAIYQVSNNRLVWNHRLCFRHRSEKWCCFPSEFYVESWRPRNPYLSLGPSSRGTTAKPNLLLRLLDGKSDDLYSGFAYVKSAHSMETGHGKNCKRRSPVTKIQILAFCFMFTISSSRANIEFAWSLTGHGRVRQRTKKRMHQLFAPSRLDCSISSALRKDSTLGNTMCLKPF